MKYDLIIIGSGPGGYVAAIRAARTGLRTALIEKGKTGGMCLNTGCIPTKALIESAKFFNRVKTADDFGIDGIDPSALSFNFPAAVKRARRIVVRLTKGVEFLLKKYGVELISGEAEIRDDNSVVVNDRLLKTTDMIIATGSAVRPLPDIFGEAEYAGIGEMLELAELPDRIAIYGLGVHSLELAQFFRMTGRTVTIIRPDGVSMEDIDLYLRDYIFKKLKKEKIGLVETADIRVDKNGRLYTDPGEDPAGLFINAGPRMGVIPGTHTLPRTADGFIETDDMFRAGSDHIYAIGDVNGRSYFAHAASAQGLFAVNRIKGIHSVYDPSKIPVNIYTNPEMAQIGLMEQDVIESGIEYKLSEFSLASNGKALAEGENEGLVRILSGVKYGEVLGVQIIASNATDMIAEAAALMSIEGTVFDVANVIHAHPTVSEVFYEAGLDAMGMSIHK